MAKKGRTENLIPFVKGKTGNPNGRPKSIPKLEALLENIPESEYQAVITKMVDKARQGDVRAAELVLDRAFGKAKQSVDHTTKGESINVNPIKFID